MRYSLNDSICLSEYQSFFRMSLLDVFVIASNGAEVSFFSSMVDSETWIMVATIFCAVLCLTVSGAG